MKTISLLIFLIILPCFAQEEDTTKKHKWTNKSQISLVGTEGNSQAYSFGLSNTFTQPYDNGELIWTTDILTTESTIVTRSAVGSSDDFVVDTDEQSVKTAEKFDMDLRYGQKITDKSNWYVGTDYLRNQFAGIDHRIGLAGGYANTWVKSKERTFKTSYGLKYSFEEVVAETDDYEDNYASVELIYNWVEQITSTTKFTQDFTLEYQVRDESEYLGEINSELNVSISNTLSLAVSLDLDYDSEPSFVTLVLYSDSDLTDAIGSVNYQTREWDVTYQTSLVVNW